MDRKRNCYEPSTFIQIHWPALERNCLGIIRFGHGSFTMTLVNIIGDVGSGKTLLMVYFAYSHPEIKAYANFNIHTNNFEELTPEKILDIREGMIFLDEAYSWLESRVSSGKAINQYLSYCLFQSRKRGQDWFTSDQLLETIDVRFRMMANYEIHCEQVKNGFKYRMFKLSRYRRPRVYTYFLDYDFCKSNLFDIYDTLQVISPIDDTMMLKVSKDKKNVAKTIDDYVKDVLKEGHPSDISLRIVKAYCIDNNIAGAMAELIYNKIKAIELKEKYKNRRIVKGE